MEARASTYSASKLGALTVWQSHVRHAWVGGVRRGGSGGHIRFEIAHDGTEEWRGRCGTEVWVGLGEGHGGLEVDLYSQGNVALHFF